MLDALHTLALSNLRGVGPKAVQRAAEMATGGVVGVDGLVALLDAVRAAAPRTRAVAREAVEEALGQAETSLDAAARLGIQAATPSDQAYPDALRTLVDAPPVLFWRGNVEAAARPSVAVVGTREPSDFGRKSARRLGGLLVGSGFTVVSGLALGCDGEAHHGCLEAGGVTVAVMAHGLDRVYPKAHAALAEQIVEGGGALVSEYAPGVSPQRRTFVARNRVQSGLSLGVVVVETSLKGGTMHTAAFALSQGRALACVARPGGAPTSEGTASLSGSGDAAVIDSPDAYARFVEGLRSAATRPQRAPLPGGDSQTDLFA